MSLDQSAGSAAGATANLGVDLKFAPTGSDSPHTMSLNLPPGLLANASMGGGACLAAADLTDATCQVGSGTVTALAFGTIPIPTPVSFDLVPPPAAGDLAGLAVNSSGTQIGSTADIKVRPSGDPGGVGVTIDFVLPNALYGVPISISEINSTFDGLRYPTTCPSTPQNFSVAVDSYADSTVQTVTAPLSVSGCSALAYSPAFSVTATRDSADPEVKLSTRITQPAGQAPSRSISLVFPWPALAPNIASLHSLCPTLSSGTCTSVGSVTATSPLYPTPLSGQAYLSGSLSGLSLVLVFPSPFPLTLTGAVDLVKNSATFTGLPDIPLTGLDVTLNSGSNGLFESTCAVSSGSATAILTDQNGDKSVTVPGPFAIAGCTPTGAGSGGPGTGGGQATGTSTVSGSGIAGLPSGHPSLRFRITQSRHAAELTAATIELPAGLRFRGHGRTGITLTGATLKSLRFTHGHLTIALRHPVRSLTITISPAALIESAALKAKAKTLTHLNLTVITTNTNNKHTTIHVVLRHFAL
ncbi:MAG TPA: hypothetical protein VMP89_18355 [Solirubrobacteraceae bacterium]|nr:hypothetical protein [Solirubrobacteraceae bacterium]